MQVHGPMKSFTLDIESLYDGTVRYGIRGTDQVSLVRALFQGRLNFPHRDNMQGKYNKVGKVGSVWRGNRKL